MLRIQERIPASFQSFGLVVAVALLSAAYAAFVLSLADNRIAAVLLVLPVLLGVVAIPGRVPMLLAILVLSLAFSARFRLFGRAFHPGGAELSVAPIDFALFFLALPIVSRIVREPRAILSSVRPLFGPFLFLLAAHLLSTFVATDREYALLEILRLLKMALLVLIMVFYVNSRERLRFALSFLLLAMIFQGALAVTQSLFQASLGLDYLGEHQFWTISEGGTSIGRAGGTLGHANVLANFYELTTPIALALVLSGTERRLRWLAFGALAAALIGTFFSFSRAGWMSLLIGVLVTVFLFRRRLRAKEFGRALVAAVLLTVTLILLFYDVIAARLVVFWEGSKLFRLLTAETAFNMIQAKPILGVGPNNYLTVSPDFVGAVTGRTIQTAAALVHNILILYAAELGLLGLAAFLLFLLAVMRMSRPAISWPDPLISAAAAGGVAGIVALLAHGMLDWLIRYDPVFTLFWFTVGLLAAVRNLTQEQRLGRNQEQPVEGR